MPDQKFTQLLSHGGVFHALDVAGGIWLYDPQTQTWYEQPVTRVALPPTISHQVTTADS